MNAPARPAPVTEAQKMARGGCGRLALMHLGFLPDDLALNDGGGAQVGAIVAEIERQGGVVDGPFCPEPVTARDFAKKMGPLGEFLVITPGHVMALSGGRLLNQSGCGNDRVAAVFWLKERIS